MNLKAARACRVQASDTALLVTIVHPEVIEHDNVASLNHPHIGAIYGLEDADGVRALVLELQHARFTFESRQPIGVAREMAQQDLDRHVAPQFRVVGAVDRVVVVRTPRTGHHRVAVRPGAQCSPQAP